MTADQLREMSFQNASPMRSAKDELKKINDRTRYIKKILPN